MKNTNEHGIIAMYRVVHSIKLVRLNSYQVEEVNKQTNHARARLTNGLAHCKHRPKKKKKKKLKVNQSRSIWKSAIAQNDGMLHFDWASKTRNTFFARSMFVSLNEKKNLFSIFPSCVAYACWCCCCCVFFSFVRIAIKINPIRITYICVYMDSVAIANQDIPETLLNNSN